MALPDFHNLSPNAFGEPSRTRYNNHNVAPIFMDLLTHTPGSVRLTPNLPAGLLLDLMHAQLPVMGAHLAADYLSRLSAFRHQYPSYTIFQDKKFLGSDRRVRELRNMFSVSRFLEADHVALDALKNFSTAAPSRTDRHQRMYEFFVRKFENYIPFFVLRPVLTFANLQTVLTYPDDRKLEYVLHALTAYYIIRDVDLTVQPADRWVGTYFAHNAPSRWRDLLATPLQLP